jgi:hypothetical protein
MFISISYFSSAMHTRNTGMSDASTYQTTYSNTSCERNYYKSHTEVGEFDSKYQNTNNKQCRDQNPSLWLQQTHAKLLQPIPTIVISPIQF